MKTCEKVIFIVYQTNLPSLHIHTYLQYTTSIEYSKDVLFLILMIVISISGKVEKIKEPEKQVAKSPAKTSTTSTTPTKSKLPHAAAGKLRSSDEPHNGPPCFKCDVVCKDMSHLKNHILSHFYDQFYAILPGSKPYQCPGAGFPRI